MKDLGVDVPDEVAGYLRERAKTWTKLVSTLLSRGKSVKKWKLIDNLGKERILGGPMDERMLKYTAAKTGLGLNYVDKEERISYLLSQLWEIFG